ncbi:hypothetical protein DFP74_2681 [Nocardiopsis sp. Huas11]|nr:hypothetical protein DFP74_2681 [Nocardiopsis sp. Huas11]
MPIPAGSAPPHRLAPFAPPPRGERLVFNPLPE